MNSENKKIDYNNTIYLAKRVISEYVIPYKKTFAISILLMIVIAGTTSLHAYLVKPALDSVFVEKKEGALIIIPIIIFLVTVIKGFSTYFQLLIMNLYNLKIVNRMRIRMYAHFIKSDLKEINDSSSGKMMASIINEISLISGMISTVINGFVKQLFSLIGLIAVMFYQSIELSLIAFVALPLAGYPIYKIGKKLRNLSGKNQASLAKFTSQMSDTLQYSKLVKSYNCENFEISRMDNILHHLYNMGKKITRISLIASPFVETLAGVGVSLVIWYGGYQVLNGETTPGAFFSFFTAMMMAYRPLKSVSGMNGGIQLGLAAATRYYSAIDKMPTIKDKENALELTNVKGQVEFQNVDFSYNKDKKALKNVNINIKSGQTIALVGHSGGGKSTIMNMILRFYDPDSGVIKIDGHDIKDITLNSLRNSMSVVSQEVMLFDDTIAENIRYGKENASLEEIKTAAKLAEADEFIQKLTEGYETKIGQNGVRLSGGQRQRIAIARAILYNSPILLLDEATSALDPISEKLIKDALNKFMKNRTTIVIAHRLSTVIHADKIFVISNGEVIESGTHKELIDKKGSYANLYSKQFEVES